MSNIARAASGAVNLEPTNRVLDLYYTPSDSAAIGTVADTNMVVRGGQQTQAWAAPVGAGTSNIAQMPDGASIVEKIVGARRQTTVDRLGLTPHLDKYPGSRAPALDLGPIYRVLFRIARIPGAASAPITTDFGVGFGMVATGNVGFFTVTQPGFGLVGDGAGGWQVWARKVVGGAATITQPITWPTVDTDLTDWEWRVTPRTEAASAVVQLFRMGEKVFEEFWSAGRLPRYPDFPNGQRLALVKGSSSGAAVTDALALETLRVIWSSATPS